MVHSLIKAEGNCANSTLKFQHFLVIFSKIKTATSPFINLSFCANITIRCDYYVKAPHFAGRSGYCLSLSNSERINV